MSDKHFILATELGQLLLAKKWWLTTAESCTGGLVAGAVTDIAGSSAWFDRGFVTYTNQAKQEMLSVPESVLNTFGAVSEQTVRAMAEGALHHSSAQVSVAVSGIAGPSGGSPDKPVGLVWFGFALCDPRLKISAQSRQFTGDRQQVRQQAVEFVLVTLRSLIK